MPASLAAPVFRPQPTQAAVRPASGRTTPSPTAPSSLAGTPLAEHDFAAVPVMLQRQAAPASPRPPFDDQPPALKATLEASFAAQSLADGATDAAEWFNRLDAKARLVLIGVYQRLSRNGLWAHVRYVQRPWTAGVGGLNLIVLDHVRFLDAALAAGTFCIDTPAGALLHPGTTSLREVSSGDSLHLSIGVGNAVSAHIDAISPVAGREVGGRCRYEPTSAAAHIGREVVPLAVPGLQIFPEPRPVHGPPERGEAPPELIRFEVRF